MDDADLTAMASELTPWLMPLLARGVTSAAASPSSRTSLSARFILVLGDPLRGAIWLSRRVLHLLCLRAQRPSVLDVVSSSSTASAAPHGARLTVGPVAQLALCQADALLLTAARMTIDAPAQSRARPPVYVTLAPHSLAEAATLVADGRLRLGSPSTCGAGRVLALPRAGATAADNAGNGAAYDDPNDPNDPDDLSELAELASPITGTVMGR